VGTAAVTSDDGPSPLVDGTEVEAVLNDLGESAPPPPAVATTVSAPPTQAAPSSSPEAAKSKPEAKAAETPLGNGTQPLRLGVPPPVYGGTEGDLLFAVTATAQPSETADLGAAPATSVANVEPGAGAKAHRSLLDLKPLFMGIQADRMRRRSLLGGKCVLSLADVVFGKVCKDKKKGQCTFYDMPPMSIAMQTLFKNAQTNYCKFNSTGCDASFCYTYGGPVDPKTGLQLYAHHAMDDYPIWVPHNSTVMVNGTKTIVEAVTTQMISFKVALEKVTFCEKLDPPRQTADGSVKTMSCYSSRLCKMEDLVHKKCFAASSHVKPAPEVKCPTDTAFTDEVKAKEATIPSVLCSQL